MRKSPLFFVCLTFVLTGTLFAQNPQTGFPPYGSFEIGGFDAVNRQNLNVNFAIPIVSNPARGKDFTFALVYDSLIWKKVTSGSTTLWSPVTDQSGNPTWGWKKDTPPGMVTHRVSTRVCVVNKPPRCIIGEPCGDYEETILYSDFAYTDVTGTRHPFGISYYADATSCGYPTGPTDGYATDGSGIYLEAAMPGAPIVKDPAGTVIQNIQVADTNGNFFSAINVSGETHWKDSAGRVALKIIKRTSPNCVGSNTVSYPECIEYRYFAPDGAEKSITLYLKSFNIKVASFGCAGIQDYDQPGKLLPERIDLPNNRSYTFEYEVTPSDTTKRTGRLQKVTLPTGGSYEYIYPATPTFGMNCSDATVTTLTRKINDGTSVATWEFSRAQVVGGWETTVTAPLYNGAANQAVFKFDPGGKLLSEKSYQGAVGGTLLRTTDLTWAANGTPASTTVTLGSKVSRTETTYNEYGNLLELKEYDWGSGAPGAIVRTRQFTYLSDSAYTSRNIRNRVIKIQVREGGPAGTVKSQTDIAYDGTAPFAGQNCVTGAVQHNDANYGCTFLTRGNPISITRYVDAAALAGPVTQTIQYDSLGNVRKITDPGGHNTTIDYTDSWENSACPTGGPTFAFPTTVTNHLNQATTTKNYSCTSQAGRVTDPNSKETVFAYDFLRRPSQINFPDGGQITVSYDDDNRTVTITQKRTDTANIVRIESYNPLGLLSQQQLPGNRKVDIAYDPFGRVQTVSNPYVNAGESTSGVVETLYDVLGRVISQENQDGTSVSLDYSDNTTRVTDEAGKKKLFEVDALGRLKTLCQVTAGNARSPNQSCNIGTFGESGYVTTYAYDVLDNLSQSNQGVQVRNSTFDGLSRIISAKIIEISTTANVTYSYADADGNLTSVTDPRGTVCMEYDALHRLKLKKHFTSGTCSTAQVVASFSYDGTQANNAVGRLISEWDGNFSGDKTDYTYDPMGRVKTANRTVSGTTYNIAYAYDLMGNLSQLTYPSGRVVEYGYNVDGELFKTVDATNPAAKFDYATNALYQHLGPLQQLDFGNGVRTNLSWNKRFQLIFLLTQKVGGSTFLNLAYTFFGNGQIQQITNNLDNLKSETFIYDGLLRLFTAQRGPDTNIQRKYEYDYDRYANRWGQNVTAGTGYSSQLDFDMATNRITTSGFVYDNGSPNGPGNLTSNGPGTSYSYDLENFMVTAGTSVSYKVDAQGRRVRKTVSGVVTDYFYMWDTVISEKQGSTWTDYIFFGGQRIAKQTGNTASTATYIHADHLGSARVCTDANGNSTGTCIYEPFGEIQPGTSCSVPVNYRFAGMEFDSETDLYHTRFRKYDVNQGRWMSVDPLAGSTDNPQSLDRYVYVLNDPINLVDPSGLSDRIPIPRRPNCYVDVSDPDRETVVCDTSFCELNPSLCGFGFWPQVPGGEVIPEWLLEKLNNIPSRPAPNLLSLIPPITVTCSVTARVLQGNPTLIGREGAFPGVRVAAGTAAIIPSQFGLSKEGLRPFINQIGGAAAGGQISFQGITDVIGGRSPIRGMNVRDALQHLYPNTFIVELVSAPRDFGIIMMTLTVPAAVPCPTRTRR